MVLFAFLPPLPFIGEWGIIFIGIYTMPVAMVISVFQSVLITEKNPALEKEEFKKNMKFLIINLLPMIFFGLLFIAAGVA